MKGMYCSADALSAVHISDEFASQLLDRKVIPDGTTQTFNPIADKVVLITGAAGSVGSRFAFHILKLKPRALVLVDRSEHALFTLKTFLTDCGTGQSHGDVRLFFKLTDVADADGMENIFRHFKPQLVFHMAACKHVGMLEENVHEAVRVNVTGTRKVCDLALKYAAEKLVYLSTDKAVDPVSVLGASKKMGEMYIDLLRGQSGEDRVTKFSIVRLGNILGSNGSVVPIFLRRIRRNEALDVRSGTSRFFLTSFEACYLMVEVLKLGEGNFVFERGGPVSILELAKRMIQLFGGGSYVVPLCYTGLERGERSGESLYSRTEMVCATAVPDIKCVENAGISRERTEGFRLLLENSDTSMIDEVRLRSMLFLS